MSALTIAWSGLLLLVLGNRSGRIGPGQMGPGQMELGQIGPGRFGLGRIGLGRIGPLGVWALALLVGAAGVMMALSEQGPVDRLAGASPMALSGNAILLLAAGLSWTAARVFARRTPRPWVVMAGPAAVLAVGLAVPGLQSLWLVSAIGAVLTTATTRELWRCRGERLPALRVAIVLLAIHAAVYFARAALAGAMGPTGTEEWLHAAFLIEGTLHTVGMSFVLLALTSQRASLVTMEGLRRQAFIDGLTGLANRRHFDSQLSAEYRRAARHGSALALLLIDVDQFKRFNDRYGHLDGDECLRGIAACLGQFAGRPGDLAARFGGEEFALLLPGADLAGAAILAEQVREAVGAMDVPHLDGIEGRVTVSIGVAVWTPEPTLITIDDVLRLADRALYAAKAAGRNAVFVAGSEGAMRPLRSAA